MNPIAEEILSYIGDDKNSEDLAHYGMPRRSGRYPWGSGEDAYQHSNDFLGEVEKLRKSGFTYTDPETGKIYSGDVAIAKFKGLSSGQFRAEIGICKDTRRMYEVARARSLQNDNLGYTEIGKIMGKSESTVRELLNNKEAETKMMLAQNTADYIKGEVDKRGMIDVGVGVERQLNISKEKLDQALYMLEKDGYPTYSGRTPQMTNPGQMTTLKIICPPGTEHKEIYNPEKISQLKEDISRDGGQTFEKKFHYPASMDSKRLMVRYAEEGGLERDGTIEIRRGVPDLSLGESRYSQVRVLVDGTHYLKGMALYSDDMPDGVDVIFNTNKKQGTPMGKVLKEIKSDPDNPFGSLIKDADQGGQYFYDSKTGLRCKSTDPNAKLGLINKRSDEGDWTEWKDSVPSQFLGKQSQTLAKRQLKLAQEDKLAEFNEYKQLNNPTIKKYLLNKFADECDSAAVDLKGAALPGQKYHVIIPNNTLKDNEVYAPGYENGTKLALVRYPHGGTFEIPMVTVNNKNTLGKKQIGTDPIDAICINHRVAERLSGADFDGDTVMCIPTSNKVKIISTDPLKGLVGFDPKDKYGPASYEGKNIVKMTKANTQKQMGVISNLITDMTLAGANEDELAAAVRHSMVVIDAEKHKLNFKQSEIDNNIGALHKKYQGKESGGAATLLSKAKGQASIPKTQGTPKVNTKLTKDGKPNPDYDPNKPEGSLIYKTADDLWYPVRKYDKETKIMTISTNVPRQKVAYDITNDKDREYYNPVKRVDANGKVTFTNADGTITYKSDYRKTKTTKMAATEDARTLMSKAKYPMEEIYADYANYMKDMARQARMEVHNTGKIATNASAKKTYAKEVKELEEALNEALKNAPKERAAQLKTRAIVDAKLAADPNMEKKDIKKASQQALTKSRAEVGSVARSKREIQITNKQWEAIQAGAVSEQRLKQILDNSNVDKLRERATPKSFKTVTPAKASRIRAMAASGKTLAEIANALGVSTSTVSEQLKGGN